MFRSLLMQGKVRVYNIVNGVLLKDVTEDEDDEEDNDNDLENLSSSRSMISSN